MLGISNRKYKVKVLLYAVTTDTYWTKWLCLYFVVIKTYCTVYPS